LFDEKSLIAKQSSGYLVAMKGGVVVTAVIMLMFLVESNAQMGAVEANLYNFGLFLKRKQNHLSGNH
jgi:hypothetical protein